MRIGLTEGFEQAAFLARRDRTLLIPLAGLFYAWPALCQQLLIPPLNLDGVAQDQQAAVLIAHLTDNAGVLAFAMVIASYGSAVIQTLYLHPARPDVQGALMTALRGFPRYLAGVFLAGLVAAIGFFLLILPGVYFTARGLMIGPRLIARPDERFGDAVGTAVAMTGKGGWMIAAMWLIILIGSFSASIVARGVDALAMASGSTGQIVQIPGALVVALASGAAGLALVLVQVALYRRLTGSSSGI